VAYAFSLSSFSYSEESIPSAEYLLSKLGPAIRGLDYEGIFTYEYGGKLETFQLLHLVDSDHEFEQIERITGLKQNFSRSGQAACNTIGSNLLSGRQLSASNGGRYGLNYFYRFSTAGSDRVAGRDVWVIKLIPLDEFRYGLSFSIDKETFLPLRYVVFDPRKSAALERMQFASLDLNPLRSQQKVLIEEEASTDSGERTMEHAEAELPVSNESSPVSSLFDVVNIRSSQCVEKTYSPPGHSPWKPTWLPPGYLLTGYSFSEEQGHMETYTDGLTAFSIFVLETDAAANSEQRIQQGVSSKGAITAMLSQVPYRGSILSVSIVGELPARVAQKITLSLAQVKIPEGVADKSPAAGGVASDDD
jgi:sigma-E factor negative regulatory protein RseB